MFCPQTYSGRVRVAVRPPVGQKASAARGASSPSARHAQPHFLFFFVSQRPFLSSAHPPASKHNYVPRSPDARAASAPPPRASSHIPSLTISPPAPGPSRVACSPAHEARPGHPRSAPRHISTAATAQAHPRPSSQACALSSSLRPFICDFSPFTLPWDPGSCSSTLILPSPPAVHSGCLSFFSVY